MSDERSFEDSNIIDNSETTLHKLLKKCANFQSSESLLIEDFNDVTANSICDYYKMLSTPSPNSTRSSNVSTSSYASGDSFGENILEENGRISLAYENLRTIPKRIAEKFAAHTKCLDLSYNNFQNLSFLSFFEALHTLILDRNGRLDVNTLPYLPNLRILWINNCDISNVATWIQRMQMQCPVLEQLSIMGNPGINSNFSFCTLTSNALNDPATPTSIVADYREYIFHVLPDLEYLDGVARSPSTAPLLTTLGHCGYGRQQKQNNNNFKTPVPSSVETAESIKNETRPLNGNNLIIQNNNNNNYSNNGFLSNINNCSSNNNNKNIIKNTPTLSFKEIFRLKRRKKTYQTSSTN